MRYSSEMPHNCFWATARSLLTEVKNEDMTLLALRILAI
jgi:hypothetical protein